MKIIILGIIIFGVYNVIPNYYNWLVSKKIIKKIDGNYEIALTFDDGPDRRYTPELLDVLRENEVRASFFVVANNAVANKDIITRMVQEGHTVGLHTLKHKNAWLSFPWETTKDFSESIVLFKKLGIKIKYFRPPWGKFNILTQFLANKFNLKTILWTISAKDWSKSSTDEDIKENILKQLHHGGIIVLHDCNGAEGAPLRTISALREAIPLIKKKGYKFVTISEKLDGVKNEEAC